MNSKYNTFFIQVKRKTTFWVALASVFYCFIVPVHDSKFEIQTSWGKANALIYKGSHTIFNRNATNKLVDSLQVERVLENHSIVCSFSDTALIKKLIAHKNDYRCPNGKVHKKGTMGIFFENHNDTVIPYFYIVTGKNFTREILEKQQARNENEFLKQCLIVYLENINKRNEIYRLNRYPKAFDTLYPIYKTQTDSIFSLCGNRVTENFKYNDSQIANYTTLGGVPQLDGIRFWLVGEIYSGFEIIERIVLTKTDAYFRATNKHKLALKIL